MYINIDIYAHFRCNNKIPTAYEISNKRNQHIFNTTLPLQIFFTTRPEKNNYTFLKSTCRNLHDKIENVHFILVLREPSYQTQWLVAIL